MLRSCRKLLGRLNPSLIYIQSSQTVAPLSSRPRLHQDLEKGTQYPSDVGTTSKCFPPPPAEDSSLQNSGSWSSFNLSKQSPNSRRLQNCKSLTVECNPTPQAAIPSCKQLSHLSTALLVVESDLEICRKASTSEVDSSNSVPNFGIFSFLGGLIPASVYSQLLALHQCNFGLYIWKCNY